MRFISSSQELKKTLNKDQSLKATIIVKNEVNKTLENISFSLTGNLKEIITLNITNLDKMNYLEEQEQIIWINKEKNAKEFYDGDLIVESSEGHKDQFSISLTFTSEEKIELEKEEIDLGQEQEGEDIFKNIMPINLTKETKEKEKKKNPTLLLFIIIILIIIVISLLLNKSKPRTYKDYISKIKR